VTSDIGLVLGLVAASAALFVLGKPRVDVVALLVMVALAVSGVLAPEQAVRGFGNPSVVTVWAVFILAGGVARTGVAGLLGRQIERIGGSGERGLIAAIMGIAGLLAAMMNNVGAVALLLPVVMDLSRSTGHAPSKLLIPLSVGSLLGGMTTLIGTSTNILANDSLLAHDGRGLGLFGFTPVALPLAVAGVLYMALYGRRLLPARDMKRESFARKDVADLYGLNDGLRLLQVPDRCRLNGRTIAESRLGAALGLQIVAILRGDATVLAPGPQTEVRAGDRLVVDGQFERLRELRGWRHVLLADPRPAAQALVSARLGLMEAALGPKCGIVGRSLQECDFRGRFRANVLALRRGGEVQPGLLPDRPLLEGDTLLLSGTPEHLVEAEKAAEFRDCRAVTPEEARERFGLGGRLTAVRIAPDSNLVGKTVAESRLGDGLGMTVLGIVPAGSTHGIAPEARPIAANDTLLVLASPEEWEILRGIQELSPLETESAAMRKLVSDRVGLVECVLSPRTTLAGKTLRQAHFREKYGLSALALWREGRAIREGLRDWKLRLGDALLLYGPRERIRMLGADPDFLVLTQEATEPARLERAPQAAGILLLVVAAVVLGLAPVYIAATAGAALMVLLGCLTMDEAYRCIEWRSVFLMAGMLSLGLAMRETGAARLVAEGAMSLLGSGSPVLVAGGIFLFTNLACQFMPATAVVALLTPVALDAARALHLSAEAAVLAAGLGASSAIMSPVAHPASLLVMGPGGYAFRDYARVGLPLTILLLGLFLLSLSTLGPT